MHVHSCTIHAAMSDRATWGMGRASVTGGASRLPRFRIRLRRAPTLGLPPTDERTGDSLESAQPSCQPAWRVQWQPAAPAAAPAATTTLLLRAIRRQQVLHWQRDRQDRQDRQLLIQGCLQRWSRQPRTAPA
jgi:hypothetical protein